MSTSTSLGMRCGRNDRSASGRSCHRRAPSSKWSTSLRQAPSWVLDAASVPAAPQHKHVCASGISQSAHRSHRPVQGCNSWGYWLGIRRSKRKMRSHQAVASITCGYVASVPLPVFFLQASYPYRMSSRCRVNPKREEAGSSIRSHRRGADLSVSLRTAPPD